MNTPYRLEEVEDLLVQVEEAYPRGSKHVTLTSIELVRLVATIIKLGKENVRLRGQQV